MDLSKWFWSTENENQCLFHVELNIYLKWLQHDLCFNKYVETELYVLK